VLLALLSLGNVTEITGVDPGSVLWTFAAADKTFDYLGADQSVTVTYAVAVSDIAGAVTRQCSPSAPMAQI
jgi:fibronectin-binding autotransporter adhesin